MPTSKPPAMQTVTYSGGSDGVVISFSSGHRVEFTKDQAVEICSKDAKELSDNPDFKPAAKAAPSPSTKTSEEDE